MYKPHVRRDSQANFCAVNNGMCRAIFEIANAQHYEQPMVVAAINKLLGSGSDADGTISAALRHSRWNLVEKEANVCSDDLV
jgi:hypothetical protein